MISDALLREAAAEAEVCLLANLPEIQPHEFSTEFERKMKRLISRANHPIRHQVLRYAAAVLLAILTLFGAVIAVSPEARAMVVDWAKSTFYEFFAYSNTGQNKPAKCEYYLETVPEGYALLNIFEKENGKKYLFVDETGNLLQFSYVHKGTINSLFIDAEGCQQYFGYVRGIAADIFIADDESGVSSIVWRSDASDVLFYVFAKASPEELIEIAEMVQKKSQ